MSNPFLAEIRIFGFNFAPRNWAFCNGQLLPLSQNTALFALLGPTYGGDGKSTFALPNLQGSAALHQGQGPGLSTRFLGESSGSSSVTLIQTEIPVHNHTVQASGEDGDRNNPTGLYVGRGSALFADGPLAPMAPQTLAPAGGSLPHNNMMPYLTLNFCIALQGVFPPRS